MDDAPEKETSLRDCLPRQMFFWKSMKTPADAATSSSDDRSVSGPFDIGRPMAKGTGWTVGTQLKIQAIAMLSMVILARLLVPADFGLVALATALSGALHAISEFSFDLALIQNQSAARREYDAAWTLSICRNALLAGALAAGARLIASSFGDDRIEAVVYWLALGTFFSGFQNIAVVDFRKELAFSPRLGVHGRRQAGTGVCHGAARFHLARLLGVGGRHRGRFGVQGRTELCDARLSPSRQLRRMARSHTFFEMASCRQFVRLYL